MMTFPRNLCMKHVKANSNDFSDEYEGLAFVISYESYPDLILFI